MSEYEELREKIAKLLYEWGDSPFYEARVRLHYLQQADQILSIIAEKCYFKALDKPKVYIASPYSSNPEQNVLRVLKVADRLLKIGYLPIVPHLSHYWEKVSPKPYETWLEIGRALLEGCDVLLRLPGESKGADGEVKYAKELHIPVFFADDEVTGFNEWMQFRREYKR
jgi:hypothetical protein